MSMIKVAITNQKGGVGKSTVSAHMAFFLAEQGNRVLVIDLDPQANCSKTLSKSEHAKDSGFNASSLFKPEALAVPEAQESGIYVIKADAGLADVERMDNKVINYFRAHIKALEAHYDFCVIDTAPTIGVRMSAALIASQYVLAPVELEDYSLDGITMMLQTIIGIKQRFNPSLHFLGMLPNRVKGTSPRQKEALQTLLSSYAQYMVHAKIGDRQSIPESLGQGMPVWLNKKTSAREAGSEMLNALGVVTEKIKNAEQQKGA